MATIDNKKLSLVKKLYYQDLLPMKKVAEKLGVSLDAIVYFMRHNNLKRRTLKVLLNTRIKYPQDLKQRE